MSEPEPDFREWGRRLLSKPRAKLPEPKVYAKRRKIRAVIAHPETTPAERQAAISALERLDRSTDCVCLSYGHGLTETRVVSARCPVHGSST